MSPTFAQLGVPQPIVRALESRGIDTPFAIQAATIRDALDGRDVCGRAPTGSGKTIAFGIPVISLVERAEPTHPRALILSPTRELADQIADELRSFAGPVRVGVVYGGVGYPPQIRSLRKGIDVLVACPGRLEDLMASGDVHLDAVDLVVVDEADRMADMGFLPSVKRILGRTAQPRQTLLFSATLDGDVAELTRDHQVDPVRHEVGEETPDVRSADHVFWQVPRADRIAVTAGVIDAAWPAVVFVRTRHGADRVAKQLTKAGVASVAIHGGRSQNQRTRALADFVDGRAHALVATDVAARGIHVDGVSSVVHFDPPEDHKTYVHRSGRTARAGATGVVVSLLDTPQVKEARKVQRQIGLDEPITEADLDGLRSLSRVGVRPEPAAPVEHSAPAGRSGNGRKKKGGSGRHASQSGNGRSNGGQAKGGTSRNGNSNGSGSRNGNAAGGRPNGRKPRSGASNGGKPRNGGSGGGKSNGGRSRNGGPSRNGRSRNGTPTGGGRGTNGGQRRNRTASSGRR